VASSGLTWPRFSSDLNPLEMNSNAYLFEGKNRWYFIDSLLKIFSPVFTALESAFLSSFASMADRTNRLLACAEFTEFYTVMAGGVFHKITLSELTDTKPR